MKITGLPAGRPPPPDIFQWLRRHELPPSSQDLTEEAGQSGSHSDGIASHLYKACILALAELWTLIQHLSTWPEDQRNRLQADFSRFYLWGSGLPFESLEEAENQPEETRNVVLELLWEVGSLIIEGDYFHIYTTSRLIYSFSAAHKCSVDVEKPSNLAKRLSSLEELIEAAKRVVGQDEGEDSPRPLTPVKSDDDAESTLSPADFLDNLDFYLGCLADLAPTIENSCLTYGADAEPVADIKPGDEKTLSSNSDRASLNRDDAQNHFVLQVRDKFPLSPDTLVKSLGVANWQRYLRLRHLTDPSIEDENPREDLQFVRPNVPTPSKFNDSGLGSSVRAQTVHAGSLASHSSFISSKDNGEETHFRVPPTPREVGQKKPFDCFICKRAQDCLKTRVDWK